MKSKNHDHLESNIESLLAGTEPLLSMPETVRREILARLVEPPATAVDSDVQARQPAEPLPEIRCVADPSEPRSPLIIEARTSKHRRLSRWLVAAAAVLMLVLGGLWYSGGLSNLRWLGVAGRSQEMRTMAGYLDNVIIRGGEREEHQIRFYFQDPGLSRSELLLAGESVKQITIVRREPGLAQQLTLYPEARQAELVAQRLRGQADDLPFHPVAELWQRALDITSTAKYQLGEEELNGVRALVYEAPAQELLTWDEPPPDPGKVKLWVAQDTGRPIAYHVKSQESTDTFSDITASQLEWDVPLADSLFDLSVPQGWQLKQSRYEVFEPAAAVLAKDVSLRIGPETNPTLIRENDIASVINLKSFEDLDRGSPTTISLTLELRPAAAARLRAYTEEHSAELLLADFNSEIRVVPKLEVPRITLDLSRLEKSLGELERHYLLLEGRHDQAAVGGTKETPGSPPAVLFEVRSASDQPIEGWSKHTLDGRVLYLSPQVVLTNSDVARAWHEPSGNQHWVGLAMTEEGAIKLARYTQEHIGEQVAFVVNGEIVIAPYIQGVLSERAIINGDFSAAQALALSAGITRR